MQDSVEVKSPTFRVKNAYVLVNGFKFKSYLFSVFGELALHFTPSKIMTLSIGVTSNN
jgi:hypothetical protein